MRPGLIREDVTRRQSRAAIWSVRLAVFAVALLAVGAPSHRYGLLETVAFFWVLGLAGALSLVALALSWIGFSDLWRSGDRAGRRSLAGALLAMLALSPYIASGWRFFSYPALADVSTDVDDPPALIMAPARRDPRASAVTPIAPAQAALILERYPEVNGRRYAEPRERLLAAVLALAERRGWTVVAARGDGSEDVETTVEALAGSYLLRFPADVAIRLTDEGPTTFVDMRSASHYGRHDLGDNAMRITRFLADLDAAVAALPAGS